jgi:hypothetical protein
MRKHTAALITTCILAPMIVASGTARQPAAAHAPLAVSSATVTIQGTSRKDPFLASTRTVRVNRLQLAEPRSNDLLQQALRPGGLEAFDLAIPVATLTSPDHGVDAHIQDSLKAETHPEIRFQLRSVQIRPDDAMGFAHRSAVGMLTVAGVEREVTLDIKVVPAGTSLMLEGRTDLLMTDFGVVPPRGLLGLLKTDPVIHVRFYLVVTAAEE